MTSITTIPSPILINNPSILTYTNLEKTTFGGEEFVLKDSSGIYISDIYTSPEPILNVISTNLNSSYASTSSYCLYSSTGNIYTSMKKSSISGNGFIQLTDTSGISSVYLQFNNGSNPPIPSNFHSPQYPTSLCFDSDGFLYFLVFGDNNVYKINDINNPSTSFIKYNNTSSVISAPYDIEIDLNTNYIYVSATNPPHRIQRIDTSGNTTYLPNYTADEASYGICIDNNNNLYIGYANGVIGKYNLNSELFIKNYVTLAGEGTVLGLSYYNSQNIILANTNSTNIYSIELLSPIPYVIKVINNSGILGGFNNYSSSSIYGTTNTNIINYNLNNTLIFNNLIISNSGINSINIYNLSTQTIYDIINIYVANNINYYYADTLLTSLFQPIIYGTKYINLTGYKTSDGKDFNEIFADISSGSPLGYEIGYKVGNKDLSQIFARYEPPNT
jgi:hypothetical protein